MCRMPAISAADLGVPQVFNAASWFVDRHSEEGRAESVAIECGDERVTYRQLAERVNRCGSALRHLGVRPEERVALLLTDEPAFAYAFFGGPEDWCGCRSLQYPAQRARLSVSASGHAGGGPDSQCRSPAGGSGRAGAGTRPTASCARGRLDRHGRRHVVRRLSCEWVTSTQAEPTCRDDTAFWLYSSGSTGTPKGCVHLHHDMRICAELFGRGVLGITAADRTFSVAKLFFAYGLGNALYFPFGVGATTILWSGAPTPASVYAVIERHRPTLFYSVPTGYGMLLAHTRERGPDFDLTSLRIAVSAGEALPPALFDRFKQRFGLEIIDGIGSTEALHMFISNRPGSIRPGSSGQIVEGYEARILDASGQPVLTGDIGNLWVKGTRSARPTGTSTSRRRRPSREAGCGLATSTLRMPTAISGTRAVLTTC